MHFVLYCDHPILCIYIYILATARLLLYQWACHHFISECVDNNYCHNNHYHYNGQNISFKTKIFRSWFFKLLWSKEVFNLPIVTKVNSSVS